MNLHIKITKGDLDMITTKHKEDLHISYMSALCAAADISFDIQTHDDDSTDGIIKKRITLANGCFYDSSARIQLKCTSSSSQYEDKSDYLVYKLKVKNYNDLCMASTTPIILGLLVLPEDESTWVKWSTEELLIRGCMYWAEFSTQQPSNNVGTVSVRINKSQVLNQESLLNILEKIAKEEWP